MHKNTIIFLRHAETEKDPTVDSFFWILSNEGKKQSKEISHLEIMNQVDVIYSSEEQKTILTVRLIAEKNKKEVMPMSDFNEVSRDNTFFSDEEFELEKNKQLGDLNYHAFGGESGSEALARFRSGVEKISQENSNKTILIVTHGTILNIYFADLLNENKNLVARWKKTKFCTYGIIENGKVIRDIV